MSKEVKRYAERDIYEMDVAGNYYFRHVSAMTGEGLHSKSDIAAELGWRDMQIEALLAERDAYRKALEKLATVPGCGCSFPCRCGGEEWTRAELEGRMDYAAETLARAALQGEQP